MKSAAKHILVVDDEQDICDLLSIELMDQGYNYFIANSVTEAVKILKNSPVDLVITDIRMPQKSGIELLKELRKNNHQLPVVFMTGFSDITENQALSLGASAVVAKPFEMSQMVKVCSDILNL